MLAVRVGRYPYLPYNSLKTLCLPILIPQVFRRETIALFVVAWNMHGDSVKRTRSQNADERKGC
jgi:hypothetical protein